MNSDGHSGVGIRNINTAESKNFRLTLAVVDYSGGGASVGIHGSSDKVYRSGLTTEDFLQSLGFRPFKGCQFFGDRCFYREIGIVPPGQPPPEVRREFQAIHASFARFSEAIEVLFHHRQSETQILDQMGRRVQFDNQPIFASPIEITFDPSTAPHWVDEVKFARLQELESQQADIEREIEGLSGYLPLLYGTSDTLTLAVLKSLRLLGLEATETEVGFTVDVLANSQDGEMRFGFEVTGTKGPISKKSNKLTQVVEFDRIKEHSEKTILIANTFKETPIAERLEKDSFTQDAVDFLSRFPVLMMTGWDLYQLVGGVFEGRVNAVDVIKTMHSEVGVMQVDTLFGGKG